MVKKEESKGHKHEWALILGASSGFGKATALELAHLGMNIIGVHLDRKATLPNVQKIVDKIKSHGCETLFFNVNAADPELRKEVIEDIEADFKKRNDGSTIRVMLHSLAFGSLVPFIAEHPIDQQQMDMTLNVMANSLVYWTQDLIWKNLMGSGARIYTMTSSGATRVMPSYGAVSAAKAGLESHVRQLAFELAPRGITINAIRAGVTDTPALRKIPGNEQLLEVAQRRNPSGRLTTPTDVAKCIAVLTHADTYWMTGNTIGVDGGEDVVG